jgi:hypothetical protein
LPSASIGGCSSSDDFGRGIGGTAVLVGEAKPAFTSSDPLGWPILPPYVRRGPGSLSWVRSDRRSPAEVAPPDSSTSPTIIGHSRLEIQIDRPEPARGTGDGLARFGSRQRWLGSGRWSVGLRGAPYNRLRGLGHRVRSGGAHVHDAHVLARVPRAPLRPRVGRAVACPASTDSSPVRGRSGCLRPCGSSSPSADTSACAG